MSTLDVHNSIGTGSEASIAADWARNSARPMNLHVHVAFILGGEGTIAGVACVVAPIDAIFASRVARAFRQLVTAESVAAQILSAFPTLTSHRRSLSFAC